MTIKVGIREISRNFSKYQNYDYVEIEDKKSKKLKGIFVSEEFADEVKEFLQKRTKELKQKEIEKIMEFAGSMQIEERYQNLDKQQLREEVAKAKVGL